MLKKILTASISVFAFLATDAQTDSTKKATTTFSGFVDTYYRYCLADAPGKTNNLTSFTNAHNNFELGMASVRIDHSIGKVAATADLGFGRRAQEFSYNDGGSLALLKQLFITYAASDKVKFTFGKWATHIGYELVDPIGNRNYSMSYGFSYGPFFHTGIRTDIALGGKSAFMVGVANTTDYTTTSNPTKFVLAQFSTATKNDKIKAYFNFQGGGGVTQFNIVATATLSSKWSMDYDGSIQRTKANGISSDWKSNALYLNFDPTNKFGLTLRGDYFIDRKANPVIGGNMFAATLSANIKIYRLTIIPEIRSDSGDQLLFSKGDGSSTKTVGSFIFAAVYKF
jgi:hypothetical protein